MQQRTGICCVQGQTAGLGVNQKGDEHRVDKLSVKRRCKPQRPGNHVLNDFSPFFLNLFVATVEIYQSLKKERKNRHARLKLRATQLTFKQQFTKVEV